MDFNASSKRTIGRSLLLLPSYNTDFSLGSIEVTHIDTLPSSMTCPWSVPSARLTTMPRATMLAWALFSLSKSNNLTLDPVANGKGVSSTNFVTASNNSGAPFSAYIYIRNDNCQKSKEKPKWHFNMPRLCSTTASRLIVDLTEGDNCIL